MEIRGLSENDISIPVNFDDEMSARAGFKLILPTVRDFMTNPKKSFTFPDTLLSYAGLPYDMLISRLFALIDFNTAENKIISKSRLSHEPNEFLTRYYLRSSSAKNQFENYSREERNFLKNKVLSVMSDPGEDRGDNSDIFRYNAARDSSIASSKRVIELLNKADKKKLHQKCFDEFKFMLALFAEAKNGKLKTLLDDSYYSDEESVDGELCYFYDDEGITIAIGGDGPNRYEGYFDLIVDMGGNDVYSLASSEDSYSSSPQCIIDLGGNDLFESDNDFAIASAFFGSSFIFDSSGDDVYKGAGTSVGSAVCGLGVIIDEGGNDIYRGVNHSLGAATFGVGLIRDNSGNDTYIANSNSQGFGMTGGIGVITDITGNDSYIVDARSLDIGRYEDHYVSMCQGYGEGVRPYYAGGIGAIIEAGGNDIYNADIFGQGGAYWFAMGCIADKSGNDKYNSYQYGQGAGIHLAVGILKDYEGWDFYSSNGVSQGCGHDYGFGLLHDHKGNDNYSAYSLSQGAGNANGIGIFLDEDGRDGYLNKEPGNTRGYGNSRREYGSIGLFADASGEDFYSLPGFDSSFALSSMWGLFIDDAHYPESVTGTSSPGYKIPVDSSASYTNDEYLIMAKTIEPRFSLWKDFGFRKLVEDSSTTSEFILKYLDTDDHRVALVLRDLAFRIGTSMGIVFNQKLDLYLKSASAVSTMNPGQVSFICYLFGETGSIVGKEQLLALTFDDNKRIRSSAVNALGKIRIDTTDLEFIESASSRLREMALKENSSRIFRKDIAYAIKRYPVPENIPTLMNLLGDDFFGVRFLAADALASFGNEYYTNLSQKYSELIPVDSPNDIAFLQSLSGADRVAMDEFINATDLEQRSNGYLLALSDLLSRKGKEFADSQFTDKAFELIKYIENRTSIRIFNHDK
ncbi:MAG: HEAT repeat domain-containing protein [Ignavibacteria bacterium]